MIKSISVVLMAALYSVRALAGGESHGGDPLVVRQTRVEHVISTELKPLLKAAVRAVYPDRLSNLERREFEYRFGVNRAERLMNDIDASPYVVQAECVDHRGVQRAATAGLNSLGQTVCFNAGLIARNGYTLAELVGLALHEHAHHFGDPDTTHHWLTRLSQQLVPVLGVWNSDYHLQEMPLGTCTAATEYVLNTREDHPYFRGNMFEAFASGRVSDGFFHSSGLSRGFYRDMAHTVSTRPSTLAGPMSEARCAVNALRALSSGLFYYHFMEREGAATQMRSCGSDWNGRGLTRGANVQCYPMHVAGSTLVTWEGRDGSRRVRTFRNSESGIGPVPVLVE